MTPRETISAAIQTLKNRRLTGWLALSKEIEEDLLRAVYLVEKHRSRSCELYKSAGANDDDLEQLFDLSSQLSLLLSSGFKPNIPVKKRKLTKKELRMILEVLNTLKIFYETNGVDYSQLRRTAQMKYLQTCLIECCVLLSPDSSDSLLALPNETSSLSVIAPQPNSSSPKASTRRWNAALNVSRVLKEVVAPIPIAGGFLASGFGVAVLLLEKRKKKEHARNHSHRLLRNTRDELNLIFESLRDLEFVVEITNDGTVVLGDVPEALVEKVCVLESLIKDALRFSQKRSSGASNELLVQQNITNLSTRVSQYQGDLLRSIASYYSTSGVAIKSPRKRDIAPAVAAGIFFAVVRM